MNVLVIGATGYIGRATTAALQRAGHAVTALVRPGSEGKLPVGASRATGDVSDLASLTAAATDMDAVLYAVQFNGAGDQFEVESAALRCLAEALAPRGAALVYTSGVWLYGSTYPRVIDETFPENPTPLVAKRPLLERIVLDACARGLRGIVIRPGDVYGAGGGIPAMWVHAARTDGAARIVGEGGNHWPMVHLDDLAQLFVLAIERAKAGSAYIAVDDAQLTVRAMAEAASRGAGAGGAVTVWPVEEARGTLGLFADALVLDQAATSAKARAELGWTTRATTAIDDLQGGSYVSG